MTKNDLERENKFLKLQLKIINDLWLDTPGMGRDELFEIIGACTFYAGKYQDSLAYIQKYNLPYNFYNKTMSI